LATATGVVPNSHGECGSPQRRVGITGMTGGLASDGVDEAG
jgi:hypothetical protein